MATKQQINLIVENTVNQGATSTSESAVPANGVQVKILRFGGYERLTSPNTGIIALQWGQGGTWETIRAGGGGTPFEFILNRTFIGDGNKRFRFVRQNRDPALSPAKEMVAWLEAILL